MKLYLKNRIFFFLNQVSISNQTESRKMILFIYLKKKKSSSNPKQIETVFILKKKIYSVKLKDFFYLKKMIQIQDVN